MDFNVCAYTSGLKEKQVFTEALNLVLLYCNRRRWLRQAIFVKGRVHQRMKHHSLSRQCWWRSWQHEWWVGLFPIFGEEILFCCLVFVKMLTHLTSAALDLAARLLTLRMFCGVKKSSKAKTSELSIWVETIPSYLDIYISEERILLGSCNSLHNQQSQNFFLLKKMGVY